MFDGYGYFPILNVRPSEIAALSHLPGPDKDLLLPIVGLKKWYNSAHLTNSVAQIEENLGARPVILDLGPLGSGSGADAELAALHESRNGFQNWIDFLEPHPNFIPTLQSEGTTASGIAREARQLTELGRGLVIRLRQRSNWDPIVLRGVRDIDFGNSPILVVFDTGQITLRDDVTAIATAVVTLAHQALETIACENLTVAVAGSSFPSLFTSIDRRSARIEIRERQLQLLLNEQARRDRTGLDFKYSDYASVFAGQRGFAQTPSAIRIDYPSHRTWVYHRREEENGAVLAAQAIISEPEWDNALNLWGTERIRRAAAGEIDGMTRQQNWTAVRIQLHLHQQLHFGAGSGGAVTTDEPWQD